jgi:hypothetical protein
MTAFPGAGHTEPVTRYFLPGSQPVTRSYLTHPDTTCFLPPSPKGLQEISEDCIALKDHVQSNQQVLMIN